MTSNVIYEFWMTYCRRIDGNFISSGIQQPFYIAQFMNSPSYRERDIDISSDAFYQVGKSLTPFETGGNIQKYQFICPLCTIRAGQFDGIACLTQIDEISTLYGLSILDVETRYDSFGQHITLYRFILMVVLTRSVISPVSIFSLQPIIHLPFSPCPAT